MILAGDLGGTKANLGLFEVRDGQLTLLQQKRFPAADYACAEDIVAQFTQETGAKFTAAAFDVAGPVVKNRVEVTNLPWVVEGASLARLVGVQHVTMLNDLEATAYGLRVLPASDFEVLQAGTRDPAGNQVLVAAGTGLGEAVLIWDGKQHVVSPSEGGHSDFAPRTEQEIDLLRFLKTKNEFVSCETILSGRGFIELHQFLNPDCCHSGFDSPQTAAPVITGNALDGSCDVCVRAVDLWNEIYGSEAGNLALKVVARGGVYVAGGIAVKILPKLKDSRFVRAFAAKEKLGKLLSAIPIYVVKNEAAPLWGAAWVAAHPR
jgi:glucokinase